MLKVLGIIPARSGSKGVKDKNIRPLRGLPLLSYSICAAKASKRIDAIHVNTDSEEYAAIARKYGAEVPFLRPAELATDSASSIDMVIHHLNFLKTRGENYDAVCLLQPTSPFRPEGMIDATIEKFIETGADGLISVLPVPHEFNPHWIFEEGPDNFLKIATGEKEIIRRRQDLPTGYFRDGIIYITKTNVILEQGSLYGTKLSYFESDPRFYVNIDTEKDWTEAENKFELLKNNIPACSMVPAE